MSPRSLPVRQRPPGPGPSAGPSREETRQRRKGRGKAEVGHLLPSLAGCSGTQLGFLDAASPPQAEDTQRAAGSRRPLCWGQGPTSGVPSGLACRMPTLRAAEKASGVCVREDPGFARAPRVGSPGLSSLQPLPLGAAPGLFPGAGALLACAFPRPPPWLALRSGPHSPRHM